MQCLLEENMLQLKNVVLSEIKAIIKTFTQDLEELKHSFTFMSQEYEDLKKEVNAQKLTISTITKENLELQRTLLEHSHKINSFEQSLKSCNVEIQGVPEKRNENPQTIVKKLCETISEPMSDDDIVACRRVAKLNPSSPRPRSIILTLRSAKHRYRIISSVLRYNKSNPNNKLHSKLLDVNGDPVPVFVTEHLPSEIKSLQAKARQFSKKNGFKYTWVRYGRVFIRKTDGSKPILIKNEIFLDTLNLSTV